MDEEQQSRSSRRDFLEKIGAAAALTGAAITGAAIGIFPEAHAQSPGQQPDPDPPTWPESDPDFTGSPSEAFIVSGSPFYNAIATEGGTQPDSPDSLHHGHGERIAPAIAERLHPDDAPPPSQSYLTFIPSPNILVILVDELWNDLWLPATSTSVSTPSTYWIDHYSPTIQNLRESGWYFMNYYVAACNCSPSRSAMVTGLYTRQNKMYNTQRNTTPDLSTIGSAGYSTWGTALQDPEVWQSSNQFQGLTDPQATSPYLNNVYWCGKWHLSCAARDYDTTYAAPYGFTVWRPDSDGVSTAPSANGYANEGQQPLDSGSWTFSPAPCAGTGATTVYYDSDIDISTTAQAKIPTLTSVRSASLLSSWCAVVSFVNPHDIQSYPGYFRTPSINITNFNNPAVCSMANPLPKNFAYYPPNGNFSSAGVKPFLAANSGSATPVPIQSGVSWNNSDPVSGTVKPAIQALFQTTINNDFGSVTAGNDIYGELPWQDFLNNYVWLRNLVDTQISNVISSVPAAELPNTMIVFTSDHGDYAGSHGLHGKGGTAYEEAINVPLYVLYPNGTNGSGQVQYLSAKTDWMCSAVDLFALVVESFTGNGAWRTVSSNKYVDQINRQSIFYKLAHPFSQESRLASINGTTVPYILFATDEIVASETGAYCTSPGYPYNTPSHITCLRTKSGRTWIPTPSYPTSGQFTYKASQTLSAKLVLYDYWPQNQDYSDGSVATFVEFYDFTNIASGMTAPNYGETGNDADSTSSATVTLKNQLITALGGYTGPHTTSMGLWASELQSNLNGTATDGVTLLGNSSTGPSTIVGNQLLGGNDIYGTTTPSIGYYAYAILNYYNYTPGYTCPTSGDGDVSDEGFLL